jgi:hypothetical protein
MKPITLAGRDVARYNHVCAFFDSRNEEYQVLTAFAQEGLANGEKAVHIVDPRLIGDHLQRLSARGIDGHACQSCGQLDVLPWDQVYVPDGRFDQDRMAQAIETVLIAGQDAGYPKIRIWANMGWTLEGYPRTDEVMEFEARANEVLERTGQMAVCVYDKAKISGALMMDILRSHPLVLIGNVIQENPFYTPAEQLVAELRARRTASPRATATVEPA